MTANPNDHAARAAARELDPAALNAARKAWALWRTEGGEGGPLSAGIRAYLAALPPTNVEAEREAKAYQEMADFEQFLNEPPDYEDKRFVRDYRHEAYRKWSVVRDAFLAVNSLRARSQKAQP